MTVYLIDVELGAHAYDVQTIKYTVTVISPYYTYTRFTDYMEQILAEPLADVTRVGTSVQGRPLWRIVIDDPAFLGEKKTVLMVVRQHGDEWGSSYVLEGLLDLLLERRPLPHHPIFGVQGIKPGSARGLRRRVRWVIYPLANPDGTVANVRYNANGVDLNRDWDRNGCNPGQEPETFALQCDLESLEALHGITIGGDHHGWGNATDGGFRYARNQSVTFVPAPPYQEARKDTIVVARHDPTQSAWLENGGTAGMVRAEMYVRFGFLIHTPEYNSTLSTPAQFRDKGRDWARAMVDTLFAPRFTNAEGGPKRVGLLPSDELYVTVDDDDENLSPAVAETVSVTVLDLASGDTETLALVETGPDTGVFRNGAPLKLTSGPATTENGTLESAAGNTVLAHYVDDDYPPDASTARLPVR